MKYTELKKEIRKASEIKRKEGILSYFDEMGQNVCHDSSFNPSFNQLMRAFNEGLLELDYSTLIVK